MTWIKLSVIVCFFFMMIFIFVNHSFQSKSNHSSHIFCRTDFLWMMYRSSWATAPNQTTVLAIKLRREEFERLLKESVASSYGQAKHLYKSQTVWNKAIKASDIRLQWDPGKS